MSDDTQINTPPTPNTDPNADAVVDPQTLVNEALATTPSVTPEQTEAPVMEELKTGEEEVKEPIPQIKEELPLAFIPKPEKPIIQPEQATVVPIPSVVEPVKPPETRPPVSEPKTKGKGGKILLMVLGLFLLVSSVVGGFFIYQQQFGEAAKIAEVSTACNNDPETNHYCRGKSPGIVEPCWTGGDTPTDPNDDMGYKCTETTNGRCAGDIVSNPGGCTPGIPSASDGPRKETDWGNCKTGNKCLNNVSKTFDGDCVLYYCPNGVTNPIKCGDNDPGVQISHGKCQALVDTANNMKKCWQIDATDKDGVYCQVEGCDSDVINTSECTLVSPPPSSNPSLKPSSNPSSKPSSIPSAQPSPSTTVSCTGFTKNKTDSQIKIGTTITFTCVGAVVSNGTISEDPLFPISYSYRIRKNGGAWQNLITTISEGSKGEIASYNIVAAGNYRAQCRACITVFGKKICDPIWTTTSPE